jgi:hypothetical protein
VVAGKGPLLSDSPEKTLSIQIDVFNDPVADVFCSHNGGTIGVTDGLMPEANPQDGTAACKVLDCRHTDTRILRPARTGGDDQVTRRKGFQLCKRNFIIPDDPNGFTGKAGKILVQVIGKRIIVIYDDDHRVPPDRAVRRAATFSFVSSHSRSGVDA